MTLTTTPFGREAIEEILPHREPFLLIDEVLELRPGEGAVARKTVRADEWYLTGHFPGRPVMPGVLIVEALAQTGAVAVLSQEENRGRLALFAGIDDCRFKRIVEPGDVLELRCDLDRMRGPIGRGKAEARVGGELACRATLDFRGGAHMIGTAEGPPVTITGIGAYAPDRVLTNDELSTLVDTNNEWIMERTGIRERRIAAPEQALTDLAIPAARTALAQAGVEAKDLDLLVCATVTPDMMFPTSSALLADMLGATDAAAYDLLAGCTGFMYALAQAYGMIAAGLAERALVVGGDVLSRILDWTDRSTIVLFGDGAGAVVLEKVDKRGLPRLRARRRRRRGRPPFAPRQRLAPHRGRDGQRLRPHERPRGLQVRDEGARLVGAGGARALRRYRRRRRRLHPAPGECPDHGVRSGEARHPARANGG